MFHVADNADNRDPRDLAIAGPTHSFAQRVFVLKVLAHKCFIRDANERSLFIEILWPKIAPLLQRNLHNFEVVADDASRFEARFVTRRDWRPVVD
jgi:hypothetical protein